MHTWSEDSLRFWDTNSGATLFRLGFADLRFKRFLLVGPDHELIAAMDKGLVLLRWKAAQLVDEGCQRFVRDITDEEWRRYFDREQRENVCH